MSEVILDEFGCIDWQANGWPDPNPYSAGDTDDMPYEVWQQWADACDLCEMMLEGDAE